MTEILDKVLENLPEDKIDDAAFEAANMVLYTKDRDYFLEGEKDVKKVVDKFKKRIELRPDPSITLDQEDAKSSIEDIIPDDAGVQDIIFDPQRSRVIIHADKPGVAIGKKGSVLRKVKKETAWVPTVKRMPPIRSDIIENIRSVLYESSDYRRDFLNEVGENIYSEWLREKKDEWIRTSFLGGARQVGRSCIFLQTPETKILMDVGIDYSDDEDDAYAVLDAPEFDINELDAVIVSHSHLDHSALVPYLYKFGYEGPVYCTAPTRDIMSLLQLDMIKIQRHEGRDPIYTSDEVRQMVLHTIPIGWDTVTDIAPDVRLTFYNSGHILGSSMTHLNIGNGLHNLLYTGDLKFSRTNLLEAAETNFPRLETMIIESTYGGRDNTMEPQYKSEGEFANKVNETVNRDGKILMPVLGSGRAQEIIVIIDKLMKEDKIPEVPVYLDGMLWDITAIHSAYPGYLNRKMKETIFHDDENPFTSDALTKVGGHDKRQKIIEEDESSIICATSGMMQGGPSVEYFKNLCENKNNSLILSSYQAEGTLGRQIERGDREIRRSENGDQTTYKVKMDVAKLDVSSHADRRELMNFVSRINPNPNRILVQHGEKGRCLDFASSLHKKFNVRTEAPKLLEALRID